MSNKPASAERSTALIKLNERERSALQRASEADGIGRTRWCREAVRRALEQRGFMFVRLCPAQPLVSTMAEMDAVDLSEEAQKRAMTASAAIRSLSGFAFRMSSAWIRPGRSPRP